MPPLARRLQHAALELPTPIVQPCHHLPFARIPRYTQATLRVSTVNNQNNDRQAGRRTHKKGDKKGDGLIRASLFWEARNSTTRTVLGLMWPAPGHTMPVNTYGP